MRPDDQEDIFEFRQFKKWLCALLSYATMMIALTNLFNEFNHIHFKNLHYCKKIWSIIYALYWTIPGVVTAYMALRRLR